MVFLFQFQFQSTCMDLPDEMVSPTAIIPQPHGVVKTQETSPVPVVNLPIGTSAYEAPDELFDGDWSSQNAKVRDRWFVSQPPQPQAPLEQLESDLRNLSRCNDCGLYYAPSNITYFAEDDISLCKTCEELEQTALQSTEASAFTFSELCQSLPKHLLRCAHSEFQVAYVLACGSKEIPKKHLQQMAKAVKLIGSQLDDPRNPFRDVPAIDACAGCEMNTAPLGQLCEECRVLTPDILYQAPCEDSIFKDGAPKGIFFTCADCSTPIGFGVMCDDCEKALLTTFDSPPASVPESHGAIWEVRVKFANLPKGIYHGICDVMKKYTQRPMSAKATLFGNVSTGTLTAYCQRLEAKSIEMTLGLFGLKATLTPHIQGA